jgi:hypothetical protein
VTVVRQTNTATLAVTWGPTVYLRPGPATLWTLLHESCHVEQVATQGHFHFLRRYLWETVRRGYTRNRFEVAANACAHAYYVSRRDM